MFEYEYVLYEDDGAQTRGILWADSEKDARRTLLDIFEQDDVLVGWPTPTGNGVSFSIPVIEELS